VVNIVTKIPEKNVILFNDAFFNTEISARILDSADRYYMKEIDGAIILDDEMDTIQTRLGTTSLNNLSTGLKTLLNIRFLLKHPEQYKNYSVSITECGSNAINYVLDVADNQPVVLILRHSDLKEIKAGVQINFNGKVIDSQDLQEEAVISKMRGWN